MQLSMQERPPRGLVIALNRKHLLEESFFSVKFFGESLIALGPVNQEDVDDPCQNLSRNQLLKSLPSGRKRLET